MKIESVEEFLKRGGKIKKLEDDEQTIYKNCKLTYKKKYIKKNRKAHALHYERKRLLDDLL